MVIRKRAAALLIMLIIMLCGCVNQKEEHIEIYQYPNKILYYVGTDKQLDFSGGVVEITHYEKNSGSYITDLYSMVYCIEQNIVTLHESVDLNKEGRYIVELIYCGESCKFPIEVVRKVGGNEN